MRELTAQSLSPIRDVIQGKNYGFIKARLDQLLPMDVAQSFAKVDIQQKEGIWYAEADFKYSPYSEAGDVEKEEIAIRLEEIKEISFSKLKNSMPYWEKLFVIPTQDCIYWHKSDDGIMNVVIAKWGFENRTIEAQTDIISEIITAPRPLTQIPVVIDFRFSNGEIASELEFYLYIFNNQKRCKTDKDGRYSIGSLFAEKQFCIEDMAGTQKFDFTVNSSVDYRIIFNLITDYSITVLNQNGSPVSDCLLVVDGKNVITDSEGKYIHNGYVLASNSKVVVEHKGNIIGSFSPTKEPEKNNFVVRIEEKVIKPETITIKLRGYKGEPLSEMPFKVKTNKGIIEGVTDKLGNAIIPSTGFVVGQKYNISFIVTSAYQAQQIKKRKEQKQ